MTDAVKLLTEADIARLGLTMGQEALLRERGLIAPEPVDPAIAAAMELSSAYCSGDHYRGKSIPTAKVLAELALKRGMEMRPPLTREMVREAVIGALTGDDIIERSDFSLSDGAIPYDCAEAFIDRLHAALTKEQS